LNSLQRTLADKLREDESFLESLAPSPAAEKARRELSRMIAALETAEIYPESCYVLGPNLKVYRVSKTRRSEDMENTETRTNSASAIFKNMPAGEPVPKTGAVEFMRALFAGLSPMRVVAGPAPKADKDGKVRPIDGDDEALLAKTRHVRRQGERLMELIARTGISVGQLRTMDEAEIARFCRAAESNEPWKAVADEFSPRPVPIKFILTE